MKKLTCKYNDKHATRMEFYAMVVMITLCLFPYLKHRVLGELLNSRTLVIMCFDKTITRHNQWSTLSTHIHLHANQPEFTKKVSSGTIEHLLPVIISITLDKYIAEGIYPEDKDMLPSEAGPQRVPCTNMVSSTNNETKVSRTPNSNDNRGMPRGRKRNSPNSTGYYEDHNGRLCQKVLRAQKDF